MLKELGQNKIDFIGGAGCSCCCKRNPPGIILYEGIWKGYVESGSICLHLCYSHKDSLGYQPS